VCAWFRLRLVTAQRAGELLQMRWQDIDPKSHFWTIPGEFVKNAHGHRVFLNETARKILAGVPKPKKPKKAVWVFPKSFMGDYKHVGRRLAQSTRANIVPQPKTSGKERDRADVRGHDIRRASFYGVANYWGQVNRAREAQTNPLTASGARRMRGRKNQAVCGAVWWYTPCESDNQIGNPG
jgi:integrase